MLKPLGKDGTKQLLALLGTNFPELKVVEIESEGREDGDGFRAYQIKIISKQRPKSGPGFLAAKSKLIDEFRNWLNESRGIDAFPLFRFLSTADVKWLRAERT